MELKYFISILTFLLAAILQFIFPHQNNYKKSFWNWMPNLSIAAVNILIMAALFGTAFYDLATYAQKNWGGLYAFLPLSFWGQVVITLLLFDLLTYGLHRLYHSNNFFWRFHAVHHSDTVYETSTALRFHICEVIFSFGFRLALSFALGAPILALIVYESIFHFFNFTQHSDFNLNKKLDGFLAKVFITPAIHRRHHSAALADLNSNYGTIFSFWDKLFNSFNYKNPDEKIKVGCPEDDQMRTFWQLMTYPFSKIFS